MFLKILTLALAVASVNCGVAKHSNNLQLKIVKVDDCEGRNEVELNIDINKVDTQTNSYNFNATIPYDIDDDVMLQVNVARWKDDHWKEERLVIKNDKICDFVTAALGDVWFKLQDRWNMPRSECPIFISKGQYEDKNLILDLEDLEISKKSAGILKATTRLIKDKKVIFCKTSTVELY